MSSFTSISSEKLSRLIGTHTCPTIIDVRTAEDFAADPRLVPSSLHVDPARAQESTKPFTGRTVVLCQGGHKLSQGVAASLRAGGVPADTLEGGFEAWRGSGFPLVDISKVGHRDSQGRTVWVTRSRPKVDRIACPWLIRRFIDPLAVFLFVPPGEVEAVGAHFDAMPFDIDGAFWSHRGDLCTFDVMIEEFSLRTAPLLKLAEIVRGADTDHTEIAPESSGLLAASLGLSRMFSDDLEQLGNGMLLYDCFYRWCRDASDETHDWPSHKPKRKKP